jgi:hypothetical protein
MHRVARRCGLAASILAGFVGCGSTTDELPREAISGAVTLDGRPLEEGVIQFLPAAASAGETPAGGPIRDGRFDVSRDQGPTPGSYSVVILSGGDGAGGIQPGAIPGEGVALKERIPAKYNARTTLTAEVKPGGPNTFEFALRTR